MKVFPSHIFKRKSNFSYVQMNTSENLFVLTFCFDWFNQYHLGINVCAEFIYQFKLIASNSIICTTEILIDKKILSSMFAELKMKPKVNWKESWNIILVLS